MQTYLIKLIVDVPGRTQSPYHPNMAFDAASFYETDSIILGRLNLNQDSLGKKDTDIRF